VNQKKNIIIKIAVVLISIVSLLIFGSLRNSIDSTAEGTFSLIRGEIQPDTNIVIIHISENDLASIGPWPIKRSYYALLINKLKSEGVKKIGLEVFLSARLITQTIYDNTLKNEIEKAGNVVLSSVAGNITNRGGLFVTDSLSFPSPKLLDHKIKTGSINFIREDGINIPSEIRYSDTYEKTFSFALLDSLPSIKLLKVNFISSWKKFGNISFLQFLNKALKGNLTELHLRDKIVLIGLSDTQFASSFNSFYENEIPGIAMHAFALDNLLNARYLKQDLKLFSSIIYILIILLAVFLIYIKNFQKTLTYSSLFLLVIFFSFLLFSFFYYQLSISFFIVPLFVLALSELTISVLEKTNMLKGAISEREVLQKLLVKKEDDLNALKINLQKSGDQNSELLKQKISELEQDINRFKSNEEDEQIIVEISSDSFTNFEGIIYNSRVMHEVAELIKKAASSKTTTLILGESGTGKELVAKAIHSLSERKDKPFVAVNCAALSESLLESELFGHVKGAFTGANNDKKGKFEAADQGTIFLDEIGEISENFQVKLLRVLQSGEIEKVGSTEQHKVDVRIIAATNKNLEKEMKGKKFREDLYYRLNVFNIDIPPLRNRKEDIEVLAVSFLKNENSKLKISKAALKILKDYSWKGNVRELEASMKRAAIFASTDNRELLQVSDLPKEIVKVSQYNFEDLVLESLRNKNFSHSSISETAKELGNVNRTLISENFRGVVFKTYCENNFDLEITNRIISNSDDAEVIDKVRQKLQTYISNLETDLSKNKSLEFDDIKQQFASKYKNLPVKFHIYLNEIIKHLMV
jgi:DNA-binding NtrC family response regulator/CHASE2 domain-containing sensor protein